VKIAFEAHPALRSTIRDSAQVAGGGRRATRRNLDPSHFFWQGIDPVEAVRVLGDANCIYHVHGKDTGIDAYNTRRNGTLDTKSYGDCTAELGFSRVRLWPRRGVLEAVHQHAAAKGYDGVISIEHEDSYMSLQEGFEKAVAFLRNIIIREPAGKAWWF